MGRSTVFAAIALALLDGSAVAAEKGGPGDAVGVATANSAFKLPLPGRAQKPSYDKHGWQCPPGFVWRNAGRTDWLCVDPFEARRIQQENRQAPGNWIDGPDGSRTCRPGLVRRGAFSKDVVCVDPIRRELVREMNLALYIVR